MIGVCIAVGKDWSQIGQWAVNRMSDHTGLKCHVISECPKDVINPSWLKCRIIDMFPSEDSFLVFDADILCLKHWQPQFIFESLGRPFCAVPDRNWIATLNECKRHNIPWPDCYVNGGLLMFGREHSKLWEYVWQKHPKYGSWLEQTAINSGMIDLGIETCRLPRKFNRLLQGSNLVQRAESINLHPAGMHNGSAEWMADLYRKTYGDKDQTRFTRLAPEELGVR